MQSCSHASMKFIGEQKTDDGVNSYFRCRECGTLRVILPSKHAFDIQGVQQGPPPADAANTS